jgi:hypothetical protein
MPISEISVERKVVAYAKRSGWFVRKVAWIGHVGAPDRVFIRKGTTVWIEFKAPGKKPRASQLAEHHLMIRSGSAVFVVDDPDVGIAILRAYEHRPIGFSIT